LHYLVARYGVRSMLDVGCGPGGMVDLARDLGLVVSGIDGDPAVGRPGILIHDYTSGPLRMAAVDLIWCVEFVEHVEARYGHNYLETFRAGRVLFLTHALPGQGGHHHVNEQPPDYWIDLLTRNGWAYAVTATETARRISASPFGKATGMIWTKEP